MANVMGVQGYHAPYLSTTFLRLRQHGVKRKNRREFPAKTIHYK
jgi:hypothetical protein